MINYRERNLRLAVLSAAKWLNIAFRGGVDEGTINCPLCQYYSDDECIGCPVRNIVGEGWCNRTPYEAWIKHQKSRHSPQKRIGLFQVQCNECFELAKAEARFLIFKVIPWIRSLK